MTAYEEFVKRIHETDTMRELARSLDEEPARLLRLICSRYEETGRPVADHYLQLTGYFGETMLREAAIPEVSRRLSWSLWSWRTLLSCH